jgi:hypothetical protein
MATKSRADRFLADIVLAIALLARDEQTHFFPLESDRKTPMASFYWTAKVESIRPAG